MQPEGQSPHALRNTTCHLSSDHNAWIPEPSPSEASGRAFFTPSIALYFDAVSKMSLRGSKVIRTALIRGYVITPRRPTV